MGKNAPCGKQKDGVLIPSPLSPLCWVSLSEVRGMDENSREQLKCPLFFL